LEENTLSLAGEEWRVHILSTREREKRQVSGNNSKAGKRKAHQGFLLSITLTSDRLVCSLLRLLPIAWVRLEDVDSMRASSFDEIFPRRKRFSRMMRNRYWVSTIHGVDRRLAPLYVIETHKKHRRIFLRMESAFHYRVRSALGRIKSLRNFD